MCTEMRLQIGTGKDNRISELSRWKRSRSRSRDESGGTTLSRLNLGVETLLIKARVAKPKIWMKTKLPATGCGLLSVGIMEYLKDEYHSNSRIDL